MTILSFEDQIVTELFDAQPQPVFWMKPVWNDSVSEIIDFEYAYGNKEFYKAIGISREKILGLRITNSPLLNQELKTRYLQQLREVFLKDKKLEDTVYNPVLNTYFNFLRTKIQDGVLTVIQDRTYEYKIIGELEKATQQLRSLINASQSAMSLFRPVFNEKGGVVDFTFGATNPAFASYAVQTPESLLGDPVSKWFPTYMSNGLFDQYLQTYISGETLRQEKHYFGDGVDAWMDIMSTKMIDGVLITITDQTPMKKLQFDLEHSIRSLRGSNEQLEGFAYAASHDMKEPIRKIRTFANRLKLSLSDRMREDEINLFTRMELSAERMQTLVDELLEYSQLSHIPREKEPIDMSEKVKQVLEDLEMEIEEKNAVIEVGPLPVISGYKRQMQQLLQNLIGNSLKYHKPGISPHITINSEVITGSEEYSELPKDMIGKKFYSIKLRDNGIGFDQKYAKRIFGMFQRLHGRSEYSGTGVGLSIVRKVVDIHEGYIWAEGEPGKGACFHMLFLKED